ncbi:MAG: hypothetical protein Q4A82_00890 [Corynebacterium sp.]|nr:hypothetical protein [Corynebacterium sp.]
MVGAVLGYWYSATIEQTEVPGLRAEIMPKEALTHYGDPNVFFTDLARIAREEQSDIFVGDHYPDSGGIVYGAGKYSDRWIAHGYRGLPGSPDVKVMDLSQNPYGDYYWLTLEIAGDSAFQQRVMDYLTAQNIPFQVVEKQTLEHLFSGAVGDFMVLLLEFCLALCVIGVILNSRADAVRRLHGYGLFRSAINDLLRASGWVIPLLLSGVLLATVVLAFRASIPSAVQLLKHQMMLIGGALAVSVLAVIVALWLLRQIVTTEMLAEKMPEKPH